MTNGAGQIAPSDLTGPRPQRDPWSVALPVVVGVMAVGSTWGVFRLRAEAAAACDMLERMGGFALTIAGLVLFAVNACLATGLWALLRKQGGPGVLAAALVAVLLFGTTSYVFLMLTGVPDGYPTPPWSCAGGRPPWWPSYLPG